MQINQFFTGKKFIKRSLPGIIILISILSILFSSCTAAADKKDVYAEVDQIMTNLVNGTPENNAELAAVLSNMEKETADDFISGFKDIESWESKIKKLDGNKALIQIDASRENGPTGLVFSFTKKNGKWVLDSNISISQTIDYIPLIRAEN